MTFTRACSLEQLWIGEMRSRSVAGRRVLLVRVEGGVHAYSDGCAHLGLPLSNGSLADGVITCRAHGFQYDAGSGRGINPRNIRLMPLPVRVDDGPLWVEADDAKGGPA